MTTHSFESREIPLAEIVEVLDNYRKRTNPAKDAELADSIKKHGLIQPVCVRPRPDGGYALVFGRRRLSASQAAGHPTIFAIIRSLSDDEVRITQLIENGQREDAHPIEEAEAFSELLSQRGYSVEDVVREVGKSEKHVRLRLKLCHLAEEIRTAFFEDKLTTQAAYLLARIASHDDQRKALAYILDCANRGQTMNANQIHVYIERTFMLELREAPFDTKDATLVPEAGACGSCPKQTGNQRDLFGDIDKSRQSLCTDAACFRQKLDASYLRKAEQALGKGHDVLSPEESAQLFPHGGAYLASNSDYVDLDERNIDDPERRTWRQLLRGQKLPQVLAVDPFHRTHDLVLKTNAEAALAAAGYDFMRDRQRAKEELKQDQREHRKKVAEAREKQVAIVNTVVEKAMQQEPDAGFWRLVLTGLIQGSWHESITDLVKRRGLYVKGQQPEVLLAAHIKQASIEELRGIALELVITRNCGPLYFTPVFKGAIQKYAPELADQVPGEFDDEDEEDESTPEESAPDTTESHAEGQAAADVPSPQEDEHPADEVELPSSEADSAPRAA